MKRCNVLARADQDGIRRAGSRARGHVLYAVARSLMIAVRHQAPQATRAY